MVTFLKPLYVTPSISAAARIKTDAAIARRMSSGETVSILDLADKLC